MQNLREWIVNKLIAGLGLKLEFENKWNISKIYIFRKVIEKLKEKKIFF